MINFKGRNKKEAAMYNMYLYEKRAQEEELRSSFELARENRAKS